MIWPIVLYKSGRESYSSCLDKTSTEFKWNFYPIRSSRVCESKVLLVFEVTTVIIEKKINWVVRKDSEKRKRDATIRIS